MRIAFADSTIPTARYLEFLIFRPCIFLSISQTESEENLDHLSFQKRAIQRSIYWMAVINYWKNMSNGSEDYFKLLMANFPIPFIGAGASYLWNKTKRWGRWFDNDKIMRVIIFWYKFFSSGRFISPGFDFFVFLGIFGIYTSSAIYGLIVRSFHLVENKQELTVGLLSSLVVGLLFTFVIFFTKFGIRSKIMKAAEKKLQVKDAILAISGTIVYFIAVMLIIGSNKDYFDSIFID